jgi:4-amino-4-deoxy-L-arabinose transferase-like glycosyltransferase
MSVPLECAADGFASLRTAAVMAHGGGPVGSRLVGASLSRDHLWSAGLALVLAVQAGWFAASTSGTQDETGYLWHGVSIYRHGDFAGLPEGGIAPLPILLAMAAPAVLDPPGYAAAIRLARASAIALFGVPLIVLTYATLLRTCGRAAAVTGAALIALSPNIIAHAALATTDVCFVVAALAALGALVRYVEVRTRARLAWLAAALSVALAAKYSGIVLFAVTAMVLVVTDRDHVGFRRAAHAALVTCALAATAVMVVWALHAFTFVPRPTRRFGSVSLPAAVAGLLYQAGHQRAGHPAFLMGERSIVGWWYYMPAALALKSTPAELVVLGYSLCACVTGWRRVSARSLVWRVALITFGLFAMMSHVALGVRYVLIVLPLCALTALDDWHRRTAGRPRWRWAAGVGLVAAQAVSAATIAPHYLGYFNGFSGGPATGYRYLADSNVDWGQDLPALRDTLARVDAKRPLVSYFGSAPFDEYGVFADVWDRNTVPNSTRWDWVALSVTHLDGLYIPNDIFQPFRSLTPSARAGYSILLYDTSRPEVRAAMATVAGRWPASE